MAFKSMLDLRDKRARFLERRSAAFQRKSEKPTPLRARKRKARLMAATIILFVLSTTAFAITWLSHYERFVINAIKVEGVHTMTTQSIEQYVLSHVDDSSWRYISQKNIFFFDKQAIEEGLVRDIPQIKKAALSRPEKFSQTLVIAIDERKPAALWCDRSGGCYQMDDSGFIFEEASTITVTSYTFDGGVGTSSPPIGQTFADGHMQQMLALLERLRRSGFAAGGASVDSSNDFRVHLIKGYDLKVSFEKDPNKLVRDLQLVLASDALQKNERTLAYIDLRFGNRVYFKMKGTDVVGTSD